MAYNNTISLTGNMGSEARIIEKGGKQFASFPVATTDSYKDQNDQWQTKESLWHNILVFSPKVLQQVKALKKGTRVELQGSLSYRPFAVRLEDGTIVQKMEASVIAHSLELKPLVKKAS